MRVVQYYALIIASWAHGNCDWAAEILTHAINRLEVARHGLTSMGAGGPKSRVIVLASICGAGMSMGRSSKAAHSDMKPQNTVPLSQA